MKAEITDISYSTALTFELVTQYDFFTFGAPTFPSLQKEAIYKTDTNANAVIIFIQYKLCDHIIGTGSSLKKLWGVPYYRFVIHPKTKLERHIILANLEQMNTLVFYAAPEFNTIGSLYESLINKKVLSSSTFWSPSGIGTLAEGEKNTISYKPNTPYGVLEPGNIKVNNMIRGENLLKVIKERFESNQFEKYNDEKFILLGDKMLENYLETFHSAKERKLIDDIIKSRDRIDARDYLSLVSTLLYDCYTYLVAQ